MEKYLIAKDTWVLSQAFPVPLATNINANSMIIAGKEPVIVDTGPAVTREDWLQTAWSIVDPSAVKWVFLSHDDGDHIGNLLPVLDACPNARVVTGWFAMGRMGMDHGIELPPPRVRWINDGDTFDAGDRKLLAIRPPVFDAPTTRGLFDPTTGVYWAGDAFGCLVPRHLDDIADVPEDERWDAFYQVNRMIAPWHKWLDTARYNAHIDSLQKLGIEAIATCHGPAIRSTLVDEVLRRIRDLPSLPALHEPGQEDLDHLLEVVMAAHAAAANGGAAVEPPAEPATV
jgi:flavorubredoxin